MVRSRPTHKPGFFRQGTLILLPTVLLAVVSLVSLGRDERAAELDVRNRAAENAQSLARTVRSAVNDELRRFLLLQSDWTSERTSAINSYLQNETERWEQDYPGLKISGCATPVGEVLGDGRQLKPPGHPSAPMPPEWFVELSPPQKELWQELRSAASREAIRERERAFLASNPSSDACIAARYLTNSPERFSDDAPLLATESGISFQDVACFRRLTTANAQLSGALLNLVRRQVIEDPSFVAPRLLGLAQGLASRADIATRQKLARIQSIWDGQSRATKWLEPIRRLPEPGAASNAACSKWTDDGEALAIFAPGANIEPKTNSGGGATLSGPGYTVSFVPRAVIEAIFAKALEQNKFLVPDYAAAAIAVEGKPLQPPIKPAYRGGNDILGSAEQTAGSDPAPRDAIGFNLRLFLTSREQMLSSGRRRTRLFAGLILGAVFASVAGLVSARRAFYHQLLLSEMKSNFVSSVSHELRAPIASVRLLAENLERGKITDAPRQHEYFSFIVQECRRLSSLIENVLDWARIEQGRKQYDFEPTDMIALARNTMALMEPSAREKEVKLQVCGIPPATANQGGDKIEMNVDGRAVQQALINLIDNAIKHSPKGEAVTLAVEARNGPGAPALYISVSDHGPGIPAGEQERIFERFYRRGSELRRETQGVGIGLSITRHIVTAHGGRVVVRSEPGKGARFTIELPMRSQEE